MKNSTFKKGKFLTGFTFIETLIYIGIIAIVIVSFVMFSLSISESKNKAYVVSEVQENARIAQEIIRKKIQEANNVNIGSSVFNNNPSVLSLEMDDIDANPTVIDVDTNSLQLRITEGNNNPVMVTSDEVNISNLVFTNLSSPNTDRENIRVEITAVYNTNKADIEYNYSYSLQTTVSLRQ